MKLLDEALGFMVLTSPLWLLVIVAVVAALGAAMIVTRIRRRWAKVGTALIVFSFLFLVPFSDELAGRTYLAYLCTYDAGPRVYGKQRLPPSYWDAHGRPMFISKSGSLNERVDEYGIKSTSRVESYVPLLGISIRSRQVHAGSDKKLLGEVIDFLHWGGWVARNLSLHPRASSCPAIGGAQFWRDFYESLFEVASLAEKTN